MGVRVLLLITSFILGEVLVPKIMTEDYSKSNNIYFDQHTNSHPQNKYCLLIFLGCIDFLV
jgi:hypothetical protein